jgi:hypothetical protein
MGLGPWLRPSYSGDFEQLKVRIQKPLAVDDNRPTRSRLDFQRGLRESDLAG